MAKLTPWFPASVKPARRGIYWVQDRSIHCNCCYFEAKWNGREWHADKYSSRVFNVLMFGVKRWRGLATPLQITEEPTP